MLQLWHSLYTCIAILDLTVCVCIFVEVANKTAKIYNCNNYSIFL